MSRILFVDDDPLTLETLKRSIEIFGHQAFLASSGGEAEEIIDKQLPDLIMTDMNLPDTDGLDLVKSLKSNPLSAHIPVVVLSASPEIDASENALSAGAEEYLSKPIRLDTLQSLIERYTSD